MDKRFASILAAIIIVFVAIVALSNHSNNSSGASSSGQPTHHVEGLNQKGVTLVEYGDYECPICGIYYQPVHQVVSQFNSQIQFQFRNLPLTSLHKNAYAAARAAEAAGLKGKYWQMHDQLYSNQDPSGASGWVASNDPLNFFTSYATNIGLNITQFKTDYASQKVNDAINADLAAFQKTGQEMATPTFFLDGKYVPNGQLADSSTGQPSVEKFTALLNAEIAKKQAK